MNEMVFTKQAFITGAGALDYLAKIPYHKAVMVTGGSSMERTGTLEKIRSIMSGSEETMPVYAGIRKNPTTAQILDGTEFFRKEAPDVVIAVGGGSALDAAKVMTLFYDFPELNFDNVFSAFLEGKKLKTLLVAIPSTSGTASEVTHVSVVTLEEEKVKRAIKAECIRPGVVILDANLPATLPSDIAAQTGMDALTHALEAYINKAGNDFTDALAKEAIEGLLEYLPVSCLEATMEAREKCHNFQCMAGMAFSNSGLGMVHGVSHAFGGKYDLPHGLTNAIILPYSMDYNRKDAAVNAKYEKLSRILGQDVIDAVKVLKEKLKIPRSFAELGMEEKQYLEDIPFLLDHSMKGSTAVNPVRVSRTDMKKFLDCVYYGTEVDF